MIPGSGRSAGEGISYHTPLFLSFPCGSAGKESTCNVGDWGLIPGSGRSAGEGIGYHTPLFLGFLYGSAGKESACNAGDPGSIPGSGRSTGEGIPTPVFLGFSGAQLVKNPPAMRETWV